MTSHWRRHAAALSGSAVLALGLAACGDDAPDTAASGTPQAQDEAPADAGPVEQPQPVTGGSTTLRLDRTTLRVLSTLGIRVEPLDGATLEDGRLRFPISGGSVDIDTPSGTIRHEGGLRFGAVGKQLEARNLEVRPGDGVVTAEVAGERVPLFAVDLNTITVPAGDRILLPGRAAALSPDMLSELEEELGVTLPDEASLQFGRPEVSAET